MKRRYLDEKQHPVIFGVYKFFSGSASGVVSAIILQPMDVIKTRQQGYFHQATLHGQSSPMPNSTLKWQLSAKSIYTERGLKGFWDGLSPSLIRVTCGVGLYYYLLHIILQDETNGKPNINYKSLYSLAAGFSARALCSTIMLPVTVIKTRMEYDKRINGTMITTLRNINKINKRGMFSGLLPTILRDAPNSGLYICIYHTIKPIIKNINETNPYMSFTLLTLCTGIIAGITSTFLTHPFDMIKTQMQINNGNPNYMTFRSSIRTILNEGRIRSGGNLYVDTFKRIYTGGFMRISKRALNSTITWYCSIVDCVIDRTIYESMNRWVRNS